LDRNGLAEKNTHNQLVFLKSYIFWENLREMPSDSSILDAERLTESETLLKREPGMARGRTIIFSRRAK